MLINRADIYRERERGSEKEGKLKIEKKRKYVRNVFKVYEKTNIIDEKVKIIVINSFSVEKNPQIIYTHNNVQCDDIVIIVEKHEFPRGINSWETKLI